MQPTPTQLGPYTIVRALGAGGCGDVYLATHTHHQDAPLVALKTLRIPDVVVMAGLLSEVETLRRLNHPGVVQIVDAGEHEGIPWYAMEQIQGPTLRQWLANPNTFNTHAWWTSVENTHHAKTQPDNHTVAPTKTAPPRPKPKLADVLQLFVRLSRTLAWLHGVGVVHLDLKPENVLLRETNQQPVVVDLGLSMLVSGTQGRAILDLNQGTQGTLAYMAPEQLRGEQYDGRTDLYALGCMLFEALTGQHPFAKADNLLLAHLNAPIPNLRTHAPTIPAPVAQLVERMMAKVPQQRPGYADDVAHALQNALSPTQQQTLTHEADKLPQTNVYLYRPRFVGREKPCEALRTYLTSRFSSNQGGALWIGGESGVGKTRFAIELGRRLERAGQARVRTGICHTLSSGQTPLNPLRSTITEAAKSLDPALDPVLAFHLAKLSPYAPELRLLEGLPEVTPPEKGLQKQVFQSLLELLRALSRINPVVILLDDVHQADAWTRGWLEHALSTEALEQMPVAVISTYRSDEADDTVMAWTQHTTSRTLPLTRFDKTAISSMVEDMLACKPPPLFVDYLMRQSEGNPFYVSAYLHAAIDAKLLTRSAHSVWQVHVSNTKQQTLEQAQWEQLPLPATLRALIVRRLEQLTPESLEAAQWFAVLGIEGELKLAEHVLGHARFQMLGTLMHRQLIQRLPDHRWAFEHGKLREVLYEELGATQQQALHKSVAEVLETITNNEVLATRAFHWEKANKTAFATRDYKDAALHANAVFNAEATLLHAEAMLRLSHEPSPERIAMHTLRAKNFRRLIGDFHRLRQMTEEATAELDTLHDYPQKEHHRLRLRLYHASALLGLEGAGAVSKTLHELIEAFNHIGDYAEAAHSMHTLSFVLCEQGKTDEAYRITERLLTLCNTQNLPAQLKSNAYQQMVYILYIQARSPEALPYAKQAVEAAQRASNLSCLNTSLGALANVYRGLERYDEAIATTRKIVQNAKALGALRIQAVQHGNLGYIYHEIGQLELALDICTEAIALANRAGFYLRNVYNHNSIADVHLRLGNLNSAREHAHKALELSKRFNTRFGEGIVLLTLVHIELASGQLNHAQSLLDTHEICNTETQNTAQLISNIYFRARIARFQGQLNQAHAHLADHHKQIESINATYLHAQFYTERVHLLLADSTTKASDLEHAITEARHFAKTLPNHPNSDAGLQFAAMEHALHAHYNNGELLRGEATLNIQPELRKALEHTSH